MDKLIGASKLLIKNITNFKGRANRTEFWFALLAVFICNIIVSFVLSFFVTHISYSLGMALYYIYIIAMLLSIAALFVRRLQDTNKTGLIALSLALPLVGVICLIIFGVLESDKGKNQYGAPSRHLY